MISVNSLKPREFLGFFTLWLAALTAAVPLYPAMAAEAPAPAAPAPAAVSPDYRIGPGDVLRVSVFQNDELTATLPVRPDGKISTPLVEDMVAVGKTPSQLARDVGFERPFPHQELKQRPNGRQLAADGNRIQSAIEQIGEPLP